MGKPTRKRLAGGFLIVLGAMSLVACGGAGNEADGASAGMELKTPPAVETVQADASAPGLTPAYLEGRWCYAYVDFGAERELVSTEYVFATDGSLQYQVSELSDNMDPGSYEIGEGRIKIKPTMVMFDLVIDEVRDDEFVLDAMGGKHHFLKGSCNN